MLLDCWFVCNQRIFLQCGIAEGVGNYHKKFMTFIPKLLKHVLRKQKPQNAKKCTVILMHSKGIKLGGETDSAMG